MAGYKPTIWSEILLRYTYLYEEGLKVAESIERSNFGCNVG